MEAIRVYLCNKWRSIMQHDSIYTNASGNIDHSKTDFPLTEINIL